MKLFTLIISTSLIVLSDGQDSTGLFQEEVRFKTLNKQTYTILTTLGITIANKKSFSFRVKACSDAHIALISGNTEEDYLYEIVLGGWRNTQSVIRTQKQGSAVATYNGPVLNCNEFKSFRIRWDSIAIHIDRGEHFEDVILTWTERNGLLTIINAGTYTAFGSTGEWMLKTEEVRFKTLNKQTYTILTTLGISIANKRSLSFRVKACSEAHIALIFGNTEEDYLYEIVLGGWRNTQSVIRTQKQGSAVATYNGPVLNCNEFKAFRISWNNTSINIDRGEHSGSGFLTWTKSSGLLPIINAGIYTAFGSTGEWMLKTGECKTTVKGTEYMGRINVTEDGIPCQRWDSNTPHLTIYQPVGQENYCRNPDNSGRPWCYTINENVRWQYCDIPLCS